jgi:hypothetical protein
LLDIGLYPLFLSTFLFESATLNQGFCLKHPTTGADVFNHMRCQHPNGATSMLQASFQYDKTDEALIYGDLGYIKMHDRFFCSKVISFHPYAGGDIETMRFDYSGNGYGYEIDAVREAILSGKTECDAYPHQKMLDNHLLLGQVMKQMGIKYPTY